MTDNKKTSLAFAPTAPFVRAFGAREAEQQRIQFERPSWATPGCTAVVHGELDDRTWVAFAAGATLGVLVGALLTYFICS